MKTALANAMRAFVESGADRSRISALHWSETFGTTPEAILTAYELALTAHSTKPQNTYGIGEGK